MNSVFNILKGMTGTKQIDNFDNTGLVDNMQQFKTVPL